MSKTPASICNDAPALGQHTAEVLGGVLNLSTADLDKLRSEGVVK
jgi:crotonobetainyl-CoA:carnitine CoA-transferase CaiB-like acyl-CoA transferase